MIHSKKQKALHLLVDSPKPLALSQFVLLLQFVSAFLSVCTRSSESTDPMFRLLVAALGASLLIGSVVTAAADEPTDERIGFRPSEWGPHVWTSLHVMALNLPRNFGAAARAFDRHLHSLAVVLPCRTCRDEFSKVLNFISTRRFLKQGRAGGVVLMHTLHCIVSDRLGKATCNIPFLQEEERLLRTFVKPGSVDVDAVLRQIRADAEDRGVLSLAEKARAAWAKCTEHREGQ